MILEIFSRIRHVLKVNLMVNVLINIHSLLYSKCGMDDNYTGNIACHRNSLIKF